MTALVDNGCGIYPRRSNPGRRFETSVCRSHASPGVHIGIIHPALVQENITLWVLNPEQEAFFPTSKETRIAGAASRPCGPKAKGNGYQIHNHSSRYEPGALPCFEKHAADFYMPTCPWYRVGENESPLTQRLVYWGSPPFACASFGSLHPPHYSCISGRKDDLVSSSSARRSLCCGKIVKAQVSELLASARSLTLQP